MAMSTMLYNEDDGLRELERSPKVSEIRSILHSQTNDRDSYTDSRHQQPSWISRLNPFSSTSDNMSFLKEKVEDKVDRAAAPLLPIPAFGDLSKAANDLINKDFYHTSQATLDVKLKAPNGTNVTVKGKQGFDGVTSGSIEGKHSLKPQGRPNPSLSKTSTTQNSKPDKSSGKAKAEKEKEQRKGFIKGITFVTQLPAPLRTKLILYAAGYPDGRGESGNFGLTYRQKGVTITQAWTTASLLDSKVELQDVVAPGVKVDVQNLWNPAKEGSANQKVNLAFKNPNVHSRAFINYATAKGNIDATVDITAGHEGFLVGGEAGYDVQKAAVTRYSLGVGYQTPTYVASIVGTQNLTLIAASYYQKVNSAVEVGAKAGYDVQSQKASGLELASKYKLDPISFAKAKINDRGIAALAYSTKLNPGTTLGLGLSLDTNKLNEAGHKIGTSLTFEG
ncbi:Mitochondrial outer membrane protein porin [Pseudocercospora fuligena]|uniref:Mitochondrial outer membrane protein porin n=1 Tax=Pseudocercospora fuligena TaxID=685502 RepID=A0A8H6VD99_9PEZI|nr:Mitochondrial outer membrane protein porin [Pseudocercospora fuligena]